jgi:hypothetical protein
VARIYAKADERFRNLQLDSARAYSVQSGARQSLDNLTYEELAATEKLIALADPLLHIPELLEVAFHESILKIAANFLGCIPPLYRVTVVRDFPHNRPLHSSNFHKDNDESDSLQIFVYLVDIDETRGPLVYIPGSNHYDARSCRPRLSRDLGIAPCAPGGAASRPFTETEYIKDRRGRGRATRATGRGRPSSWTCTGTRQELCATEKRIVFGKRISTG